MKTLVVTSINPYSKIAYQSACFYGWRKRGYQAISFNNKEEKELLLQHGFDPLDIVEISSEETAFSLFGRAIPRILPLLVRAAEFGADNIILVNSDIYPGHSHVVSDYLRDISSTIAMTRSDFIGSPKAGYSGEVHYRGGLDIFFFTTNALIEVLNNLVEIAAAERMTFGVPGWDFFLGHELVHTHSGIIMDGAVMFHQHHKTSYCGIQEFESYASHLCKSGIYKNSSGGDLVAEFSSIIQAQCAHNENLSRILFDQYYEAFEKNFDDDGHLEEVSLIFKKLLNIEKRFSIKLDDAGTCLAPLISNQISGEYWAGAVFYKNTKLSDKSQIEGYLLVLLMALLVKDSRSGSCLTTVYPVGNLHNKVLIEIIRAPGTEGIDVEVLKLFASELVDYSIFNMELFKYVALSSYGGNSAGLCKGILLLCQKGLMRNMGCNHNIESHPFVTIRSRLKANINNYDIIFNICLMAGAEYLELSGSTVHKTSRRLVEEGMEDIRVSLNALTQSSEVPEHYLSELDESIVDSNGVMRKPLRQCIEEQKCDLLEEDLNNNS